MPIRDNIRAQPFRDSGESYLLNETDRKTLKNVDQIFSNNNLGLNSFSTTASASLEVSDAITFCDTTSGSITITLQYANQWGTQKSPLIYIQKTATANTVTISAQSGDTINGAASYILYAKESVVLATDGANTWYVFSPGDVNLNPILRVPTVTIDSGGAEVVATVARILALFLPNAATTTSSTLQTAVNYSGSGVLEGVVIENGVGTATGFNLKITIDDTVIWNSTTSLSANDTMKAVIGQITQTTSDATYHFIPDPVACPFKTTCLIEYASTTSGQQVGIAYKIAKKT